MLDDPRVNILCPRSYLGLNWKDILRLVLGAQQSNRDPESHKPPDHSAHANVTKGNHGNVKTGKTRSRQQRLKSYRKTLTKVSNTYRPLLSFVNYSSGITPALAGNVTTARRQYLYVTQRLVDLTRSTSAAFLSRYTNLSNTHRYGSLVLTYIAFSIRSFLELSRCFLLAKILLPVAFDLIETFFRNQTVVIWKRPERPHRLLSALPDMGFYISELIEYRDLFRHICKQCRGAGDVRGQQQEHSLVLTRAMFKLWVYQHLVQAKSREYHCKLIHYLNLNGRASLDLLLNRFFDQFASSPSQGMDFTDYFFMIALLSKGGSSPGFQCAFDSYDLNGDGSVDSHDIFAAIFRGYQYILGNDIYALAKCVSGGSRERPALENGLERDAPVVIAFQDFYSASLDDSETDLGKLILDVFYRLLRTRSSIQIYSTSDTVSLMQNSDRLPPIHKRRTADRAVSSMILPDIAHLTSEQMMGLKSIFDHACQSPTSEEMSRKALADALHVFLNDAAVVSDDVIYEFLTLGFDQNRTWALSFTEFAQRISELYFGSAVDLHRIVFHMIDKNNDGQLSLPELYSILEDPRVSPILSKDIEPLMDLIVSRNHDPDKSENVVYWSSLRLAQNCLLRLQVTFHDVTRIWKKPQALSVFKKDIWEAIEQHNEKSTGDEPPVLAARSARAIPILLPPILKVD